VDKLFLRLSDADTAEIMKDYVGVTAFESMPGEVHERLRCLPKLVYFENKLFTHWLDKSVN